MIIIDNIEKIRRINDLSRELIKHGIATNSEDATKQAIDIVNKEDSIKDISYPKMELNPEGMDYQIRQRIEEVTARALKTNNEQILKELNEIKQHLSTIGSEISILKEQFQQAQNITIQKPEQKPAQRREYENPLEAVQQQFQQPAQQQIQQPAQQQQPQQQAPKQSTRGEGAEPTVRTGNYKPGDKEVQIDKFFYFGRR